jgi:hypothetical protein
MKRLKDGLGGIGGLLVTLAMGGHTYGRCPVG